MATLNRPETIKEIQARKKQLRDADNNKIRIRNKTRIQLIPLQIYGKNSKKAVHQISVQIGPGRHVDLPEYRLIPEQIATLKKRGMITTTKIGSSGKNIKETSYRQFLNNISVEQKPCPTASVKGKASKKISESKPKTVDE